MILYSVLTHFEHMDTKNNDERMAYCTTVAKFVTVHVYAILYSIVHFL
jgi:hypothetical protein